MKQRESRGAQGAPAEQAGRTGLFFCRCGPNLGQVVRIGELEAAPWPGADDVATHPVLCSPEGKAWLAERIRTQDLDRIVVAACSPREHEATFRGVLSDAGRSPWHLQMVNLREQVDWLGGDGGAATVRAGRLVRAALARLPLHRPLPAVEVEVSADVLVVGGGAAGLSAARTLAGKGRKVIVAERAFVLGGVANQLDEVFPDLECASCFLEPVLDGVLHHDRIEVLTGAEVARVRGAAGRFEVDLVLAGRGVDPEVCLGCGECAKACPAERPDPYAAGLARARAIGLPYVGCLPHVSVLDRGACLRSRGEACTACLSACAFGAVRLDAVAERRTITAGAVVVATGLVPGDVNGPDGVVSSYRLERMLHPNGPTAGQVRGAGGRAPRAVLLAADPAADEDGDLASLELLKLAHLVRARLPDARVTVAGDLDRVPQLRRRAAELAEEGIAFVPGRLALAAIAAAGDALRVPLEGSGAEVHEADLVAVHAAARPAEGAGELARLLRIDVGERGFLGGRGPSPFEPTATRIAGVFVAGAAAGPRTLADAIRDGAAAAGLVHASLVPGERRALEPLAAEVEVALCGGCGICVAACPFGAISLGGRDEATPPTSESAALRAAGGPLAPGQPRPAAPALARGHRARKAVVEAIHCHGCGTCAAACPTGAASARHFTRAQVEAEIRGLLSSPPHPASAPEGERSSGEQQDRGLDEPAPALTAGRGS